MGSREKTGRGGLNTLDWRRRRPSGRRRSSSRRPTSRQTTSSAGCAEAPSCTRDGSCRTRTAPRLARCRCCWWSRADDDRLGRRLRPVAALRTLRVSGDPFRIAQSEVMRTRAALPDVIVHAADALLCLLPLSQQRVVFDFVESRHHASGTAGHRRRSISAPAPESDDRTNRRGDGAADAGQHACRCPRGSRS